MKKLFVIIVVSIVLAGQACIAQDMDTSKINKKILLAKQDSIENAFYNAVIASIGDTDVLRYYYLDTLMNLVLADTNKKAYHNEKDTLKFGKTEIILSRYFNSVATGSFILVVLNCPFIFYPNDKMKFGVRIRATAVITKKDPHHEEKSLEEAFCNNRWLKEAIEKITKKDFPTPTKEEVKKFIVKNFEKS